MTLLSTRASLRIPSAIIDGVALGVRPVAGVELPAVEAGDFGGALRQPGLSSIVEPQTMKIHVANAKFSV